MVMRKRTQHIDNTNNTRDLTPIFLNMRKELGREVFHVMPEFPEWVKIKEDSEREITNLNDAMLKLSEKMSAPPSLLSTTDSKTEIDQECSELMKDFEDCFKKVKQLDDQLTISDEQQSMCSHIRSHLCKKLTEMLTAFKQMQNKYTYEVEGPIVPGEETDDPDADKMPVYDTSFDIIALEEEQALQRREEYKKIHKTITELKTLMTELSDLVIAQGTVMDRIDMNITNAVEHMNVANQELVIAIPKSTTNLYCWIGLLVVIIVFSVTVIVIIRLRRGN